MRSILLVALVACSEHGQSPTMGDARFGDTIVIGDAFNPCTTPDLFLTGELVDLDSSGTAFLGVFDAKLSLTGTGTVIHSTPPNGRLDTCVPPADPLRLDVVGPTGYLDGSMVIARDALTSLHPISLRGIKTTRATSFFTERGLTFNAAKAQVLVFMAGDRSQVTLDRAHGTAQAGNDDALPGTFAWTAGDTGQYVLFPNVDVTQPTGTVSGGDLPVTVPLAAGKLTLVAVSIIFI